jgi:hypothetical protein
VTDIPDIPDTSATSDSPVGGPAWLVRVNAAMDLPVAEGRAVLDEVIADRRSRADELRARAAADNTSAAQRDLFSRMAAWVDDSVDQVTQARDRLDQLAARGDVATGREQIDRETGRGGRSQ